MNFEFFIRKVCVSISIGLRADSNQAIPLTAIVQCPLRVNPFGTPGKREGKRICREKVTTATVIVTPTIVT